MNRITSNGLPYSQAVNIAVFASGNGSNFLAIHRAIERGKLHANLVLLVCDKLSAPVIHKAETLGVPTLTLSPKDFPDKAAYEQVILEALTEKKVAFIALAGYMRLIGPTLLQAYPNRIVNIHPSLLPAFPGRDAIKQAMEAGVKVTGVTVHVVDESLDNGPIIAQEPVAVFDNDSLEELEARIHETEHDLYPKTLAQLLNHFAKETSHDKTSSHQCI
jgi:phosphoribosylglycinamide formyltransferase-1